MYLKRPVGNVELKIVEGELFVKSEKRMLGYLGRELTADANEWMASGDMVEVSGDRVLFRGRKSEMINVGGVKVYPLKVEGLISTIEGIQAVHVYGKSNSVTGQIVAADIEIEERQGREKILERVNEVCRLELNRYEQPREIRVVNTLDKRNDKILRRRS